MNVGMIAALSAVCLWTVVFPAWSAGQALDMQVGESRVLAAPGVTQVAIGNGEVLSAVATAGRDVVVFARAGCGRKSNPCCRAFPGPAVRWWADAS